jgi:glucose-6-phosphate isomerase
MDNMWQKQVFFDSESGLSLDFGGGKAPDLTANADMLASALNAMNELEAGAIANPDEGRMVGHYWLRAPELAPMPELAAEIRQTNADITEFAAAVHSGKIVGAAGKSFKNVLVIGIGGSSLGPVFVSRALQSANDKMRLFFIDNTDPDGMDNAFAAIQPDLSETMVVVISKSGGTIETQNGLTETKAFFAANNVDFYANAVRITQRGSGFDTAPDADRWLAAFPMWDWVGGRTSVLSAVGLLPLSLQGLDTKALLAGAHDCDSLTRREAALNPALQLALFWYQASGGQGGTSMAVLPYKDRLELFAKYLQQLVMESLGKELDLEGKTVRQGLAVFGNKGSSDQHSYVQQLVAGPENVFVVFIEVLRDRAGASPIVREESTSGDYLQAFMLGTTKALASHGKQSMIITVPEVSAYYIGMLIALFERAVGFYASFVNINAYHQPAVEFGKKACGEVITLKNAAYAFLTEHPGEAYTAEELAVELGAADEGQLWHILRHLAANEEKIAVAKSGVGAMKFSAIK